MRHKRSGFNPCIRKNPWRRARQPPTVFLPGDSIWTEKLGGLQSMGSQSRTQPSIHALPTEGAAYQPVCCFIIKKANDKSEDSGAQPEGKQLTSKWRKITQTKIGFQNKGPKPLPSDWWATPCGHTCTHTVTATGVGSKGFKLKVGRLVWTGTSWQEVLSTHKGGSWIHLLTRQSFQLGVAAAT